MHGILVLLIANLKKRKLQCFLIGSIIALSAIMFTTAISISISIREPFDKMFENLNASQIQIANSNTVFSTQDITEFWEEADGITVQTFYYFFSSERIIYNGTELSDTEFYFTERPAKYLEQDKLSIVEGEEKDCPATGEGWISISFADQNNISIGDRIEVSGTDGRYSLKISAIVADPQFGSSAMGPVRIWISPGELKEIFGSKTSFGSFIGLRFNDYGQKDKLWDEFEDDLGRSYNGSIYDYDLISSTYLMQYQILGAILFIFSFVLLLISVLVIGLTISAAIVSDGKIIGIMKAQGYTPYMLTMLYAGQYIMITVLSVLLGIFCSKIVVNIVTKMLTRSMGVTSMEISILVPAIISLIIIVTIVGILSFLTAWKAGKLRPINAIREDFSVVNGRRGRHTRTTPFSPTVFLAIRQIFSQRGQSLLVFFGFIAMAAVLTFSVYLKDTFSIMNFTENSSAWGFDNRTDTLVFKKSANTEFKDNLLMAIEEDPRIQVVVPVQDVGIPAKLEAQDGLPSKTITVSAYDGDMMAIGETNLEGRNPEDDTEVSININISNAYNKKIGDYLSVSICGKQMNLLITGIYQGIYRMGWNLRIHADTVRRALPTYNIDRYALIYNSEKDRESFMDEHLSKYADDIDIQPFRETLGGYLYGIEAGINSFVIVLSSIFTIVMLIIIFNSTLMNLYREKRIYGMYKAVGMTPTQIRMIIVWKVSFLAISGSVIGIVASFWSADSVMELFVSSIGIKNFPGVHNVENIVVVLVLCIVIGFISSWIPSRKILNISPRALIVE